MMLFFDLVELDNSFADPRLRFIIFSLYSSLPLFLAP